MVTGINEAMILFLNIYLKHESLAYRKYAISSWNLKPNQYRKSKFQHISHIGEDGFIVTSSQERAYLMIR